MKIRLFNYGNYSSENYGSSRGVQLGDITLYFSYETVVAFEVNGHITASHNVWSTTTGKHLNALSRKNERVAHLKFNELLEHELTKRGLEVNSHTSHKTELPENDPRITALIDQIPKD